MSNNSQMVQDRPIVTTAD